MAAGSGGPPGRHGVRLGEQPMDVAFHPFGPVAAAGLVDGSAEVCAWEPAERSAAATARFACHPASCRAVRFSPDGRTLLTAAADGAWGATDVDSGALAHLERPAGAAAPAINRLETVGADCLAAGDARADVVAAFQALPQMAGAEVFDLPLEQTFLRASLAVLGARLRC